MNTDTDKSFENPSTRKRKRIEITSTNLDSFETFKENPDGKVNLGFSSTPKKYEKETNYQTMEIKSIAELAEETMQNPYEVLRKPPKKKKKSEINDEAKCFVNPALNLDAPDKKFNPFEVKRLSPINDPKESNPNCFINPALNIKAEDSGLNPFEVTRIKTVVHNPNGLENPALELPIPLTIGLPFQPTLGCRIDFQNIQLENLTPTKLLAEKLVFSPVNPRIALLKNSDNKNFRKSLSIISEELDIGKELDCYQIELENSINEAKLRKKGKIAMITRKSLLNDVAENEIGENSNINLELSPNIDEQKTPIIDDYKKEGRPNKLLNESDISLKIRVETKEEITNDKIEISKTIEIKSELHTKDILNDLQEEERSDEVNDENCSRDVSLDDIDFKAPAPFVRAYRKPNLENDVVNGPNKNKHTKNSLTSVIRRSVRKLLPKESNKNTSQEHNNKESYGHKIIDSIRHSLRRNPDKDLKLQNVKITEHEVSIIDCAERKVYKSNENNSIEIGGFNNERKHSLRSSFRQSKNHLLKSVFKKETEEYKLRI